MLPDGQVAVTLRLTGRDEVCDMTRKALLAAGCVVALVSLTAHPALAHSERTFDLQAHRGGLGLVVENTLPAFANALELGGSTLELDVQVTEDGEAVSRTTAE